MDRDFLASDDGLHHALGLLRRDRAHAAPIDLPERLPDAGLGARQALDLLAPIVLGRATRLNDPAAFAHMDPPTPWITWATTLWNASLNQNLLHPATAPAARELEAKVLAWLAPCFGMSGGHMTPGSTLATLIAWGRSGLAARIEHCVDLAERFAQFVRDDARLELLAPPQTAIVAWRPRQAASFERVRQALPPGSTSTTTLGGEPWFRNVAANPDADVQLLADAVRRAL